MKLSLSVRIVESACKTSLQIPFADFVEIAKAAGYQAICMRASAGGIGTPVDQLIEMHRQIKQAGLQVSMVTADFNVPLNNELGPEGLRDIGPSINVAKSFHCDLIRVCMKQQEDIRVAQAAADQAAEHGIRLAHQCHTSSLFEEVDRILDVIAEIDRENFGLIYEPANLLLCGQEYSVATLQRMRPHIMNVYVQNHQLDDDGPVALPTNCRGQVRFHHLDPWEDGGVDFAQVFSGLKQIDYDGFFTIHQAQGIKTADEAKAFAKRCAAFAQRYLAMDS